MNPRKNQSLSTKYCKNTKQESKLKLSEAKTRRNKNPNQEKKFKCVKKCNYCGARTQNLKLHEATHTGDRPFKCSKVGCNFTAIQHSNLKTHLRIHTGEKPYKCHQTDCNFRATQASHIRRHESVHNGGTKPFICIYCKFQTREKTHLRTHMRIHTGEKPYKCRRCQRSFTYAVSARNHERGHMGLKLFACEFCPFQSPKWMTLKLHLVLEHNSESKEVQKKSRIERSIRSQSKTGSISSTRRAGSEEIIATSTPTTKNGSQNLQFSNSIPVVSIDLRELLFDCDLCDFRRSSLDECLEHSLKHRND